MKFESATKGCVCKKCKKYTKFIEKVKSALLHKSTLCLEAIFIFLQFYYTSF